MTDLKPSRELDALVADRVLQWVRKTTYEHDCGPGWIGCTASQDRGEFFPDRGGQHSLPFFSEDIEAAWKVVDKLRRDPTRAISITWTGTHWQAEILTFTDESMAYQAFELQSTGETAPHAICLAALKAVGNA